MNEKRGQQMDADELHGKLNEVSRWLHSQSVRASETAKKAHAQGDRRKHDKFCAVARVYRMADARLDPVRLELYKQTSDDYQERTIPF